MLSMPTVVAELVASLAIDTELKEMHEIPVSPLIPVTDVPVDVASDAFVPDYGDTESPAELDESHVVLPADLLTADYQLFSKPFDSNEYMFELENKTYLVPRPPVDPPPAHLLAARAAKAAKKAAQRSRQRALGLLGRRSLHFGGTAQRSMASRALW